MSGAPFRDLFVELPRALFETLQGIGEAAIKKAGTPPSPGPLAAAWKPPWWRTEWLWRRLAERWGITALEIGRNATMQTVYLAFRRRCGHCGRGELDERALAIANSNGLDALDRAFDDAERECYCMEPLR